MGPNFKGQESEVGNSLPTFLDNQSGPFSSVKNACRLKMGRIVCPETSVSNYQYTLRSDPEERRSHLLRGGSLQAFSCKIMFTFSDSRCGPTDGK